jgi:hypothetical protein
MLRDMRAHAGMLEFRVGDRVSFQPPGHRLLSGVLTRYNRKTVTSGTCMGLLMSSEFHGARPLFAPAQSRP